MKLFKVMLALFALGYSVSSNAIGVNVTIMGGRTCGVWVKDHLEPSSVSATQDDNWLIGYLSGYATVSEVNFLSVTDGESIILWMTNYCTSNPLNQVPQGAVKLKKELTERIHK